jgi:RsiW-degrading membrane proteinase PrsW (M82 family)
MLFLAIFLGFLPGFAWLFFYMQEDPHPEPKKYIFKTLVFGMAGAVVALFFEKVFNTYVPQDSPIPIMMIASLAGLALIEELVKFGSAYLSVKNNPAFAEPIDAMIYTLVASLGFATLENLGALTSPFTTPGGLANLSSIFQVVSFRFVGATLLHALTGAVIGYNWAIAIREFGHWRFLLRGIILATILHLIFNYLILTFESYLLPVTFLMIVGFFVLADFEKFKYKKL